MGRGTDLMWKWSDLKRFLRKDTKRDTADLGAVMWPVAYPSDMMPPENPHVTVVIFNDINNKELGYTKEDVIDAIKETMHDLFLWLHTDGIEWFGAEQNVPVLLVSHHYLEAYHEAIINELTKRGIPIDMTFPEYRPHVSMSNEAALDGIYPDKLLAGPVELWWGDEHYRIDNG